VYHNLPLGANEPRIDSATSLLTRQSEYSLPGTDEGLQPESVSTRADRSDSPFSPLSFVGRNQSAGMDSFTEELFTPAPASLYSGILEHDNYSDSDSDTDEHPAFAPASLMTTPPRQSYQSAVSPPESPNAPSSPPATASPSSSGSQRSRLSRSISKTPPHLYTEKIPSRYPVRYPVRTLHKGKTNDTEGQQRFHGAELVQLNGEVLEVGAPAPMRFDSANATTPGTTKQTVAVGERSGNGVGNVHGDAKAPQHLLFSPLTRFRSRLGDVQPSEEETSGESPGTLVIEKERMVFRPSPAHPVEVVKQPYRASISMDDVNPLAPPQAFRSSRGNAVSHFTSNLNKPLPSTPEASPDHELVATLADVDVYVPRIGEREERMRVNDRNREFVRQELEESEPSTPVSYESYIRTVSPPLEPQQSGCRKTVQDAFAAPRARGPYAAVLSADTLGNLSCNPSTAPGSRYYSKVAPNTAVTKSSLTTPFATPQRPPQSMLQTSTSMLIERSSFPSSGPADGCNISPISGKRLKPAPMNVSSDVHDTRRDIHDVWCGLAHDEEGGFPGWDTVRDP
jgi:hypothetical protein